MRKVKEKTLKITITKTSSVKPIPSFRTMEKEADFWNTHSVVDTIDDGTIVGFHMANKKRKLVQ